MWYQIADEVKLQNHTEFQLFILPDVRKIWLAIFADCELKFMNSFIVKPRKHETVAIFFYH